MKIAAGILCWNHDKTNRGDLFDRCHKSLQAANLDVLVVADNGSSDGTAGKVFELGGVAFPKLEGHPHGNTCGYGMNKLAATLLNYEPDIIVLSNDDIEWHPQSMDRLRDIWSDADETLTIVSGLVEPLFAIPREEPWNQVYGKDTVGGETVWYRKSVPGGAWTFRASDFPYIFPVSTFPGKDDVPACEKLRNAGRTVAAANLADHVGVGQSTWGNASHERFLVKPVGEWQADWTENHHHHVDGISVEHRGDDCPNVKCACEWDNPRRV